MRYLWEHKNWPNFSWDADAVDQNAYAWARAVGDLAGEYRHLPEGSKQEALIDLLVSEAVKTSQIEGEDLDREDVRSSIRNRLGLNATPQPVRDPSADGIAAMMISVREHFAEELTAERLCAWHDMVMADPRVRERIEVGRWRTSPEPMQIVSGALGRETVHYEAPPTKRGAGEMAAFLRWFNGSRGLKAPVRAGVAHLHFECIHPFDDGNGRIGRAISEMALSQESGHPVLLSLSTAIQGRRGEYYEALNRASLGGLDITEWLVWFTEIVLDAQRQVQEQVRFVLDKTRFWARFDGRLNDRQSKVVNRMFQAGPGGFDGGMNTRKYINLTRCAKATATRDLTKLREMGAFRKLEGGGRSTRYDLNLEHPG